MAGSDVDVAFGVLVSEAKLLINSERSFNINHSQATTSIQVVLSALVCVCVYVSARAVASMYMHVYVCVRSFERALRSLFVCCVSVVSKDASAAAAAAAVASRCIRL